LIELQPGQGLSSRAPHAEQCLFSGKLSAPQDGQFIDPAGYPDTCSLGLVYHRSSKPAAGRRSSDTALQWNGATFCPG
jgi:hypothetical protein